MTNIDKSSIYDYAEKTGLEWHEDETNKDINYKRNYIRKNIVGRLDYEQRKKFKAILDNAAKLNEEIDQALDDYLAKYSDGNLLSRNAFIILPHKVSIEIMAAWLRNNGIREYDSKLLEKLTIGAKTLKNKQRVDVNLAYFLEINKNTLALKDREC
jgi:tRNA(Ile)-lysidine synthase TilS/MesJ